ncbi:MAG: diguanylate cyclase [Candidatus Electrothrix sp. AR4]|nr:diguanylate cyclase [Candidatus Electrothrix sp. AR4]
MAHKIKILIVDDRPNNHFALEAIFKDIEAEFIQTANSTDALKAVLDHDFALAILDVQMPEMDGYELVQLIRIRKQSRILPIIFLSAIYADNYHIFKGYNSMGVDFISKPFAPEILIGKVLFLIEIYRQHLRLKETIRELEETKKLVLEHNKLLEELASQDMLTGLYNRRQLEEILEQEVEQCERYNNDLSVLMLDLDHFKKVNDTYGHDFGDYVIREFASRILPCIRDSDFAFRFGGEEFLVLLPQTDIHGAVATAEKIRSLCAEKLFQDFPFTISMSVSIGVSSYSENPPKHYKDLVRQADQALYHAKKKGRNRVTVYNRLKNNYPDKHLTGRYSEIV